MNRSQHQFRRPVHLYLTSLLFVVCAVILFPHLVISAEVTFYWSPNTEADLSVYRLYRSSNPGQYVLTSTDIVQNDLIWEGTTNSAIVTVNEDSWLVVTAVDQAGNESDPSNELSYTEVTASAGTTGGGGGGGGGCFVGTAFSP